MHPLLATSDKAFWHGYTGFYEQHWQGRSFAHILEIGVLHGNSVRWLAERFPGAQIVGADILPVQPAWPQAPNISYIQIDQGVRSHVRQLMQARPFDLIIDDGSHYPQHQAISLVEAVAAQHSGGMFILEDINSSHPLHEYYQSQPLDKPYATALSLLLAFEHLRRVGKELDDATAEALAAGRLFSTNNIKALWHHIGELHFYRRNHLPDQCWKCGSSGFNYAAYTCTCGTPVYAEADSMTWVVVKG